MTADGSAKKPVEEVTIERLGSLALITLNRPTALNALTTAMKQPLVEAFPVLARDPQTYCVVIQSACEKAFSVGGDVRELTNWGREDRARARQSFKDEYALNWLHECFSKPTISLIDGAVMGSGVGITLYGTHRVAGERYRFAMPETAIGLFPDVGVAWPLSRMPHHIGMYLGLTGRSIRAADAYALGLVTHCISAAHYADIKASLADTWPVDPVLDRLHVDPGAGELPDLHEHIDRCFSAPTVEEVLERLGAIGGSSRAWAEGVVADLQTRSPLSLKVTHRHIGASRNYDLRQILAVDYRLACRFLESGDFYEGVRAALVDKDGQPRWNPPQLKDVTDAMIDEYFTSLGSDELVLPTRTQMQAARV